MLKEQLQALSKEQAGPCITLALRTHRTHPDNLQDPILLKNLLGEAESRLLNEFGKRQVEPLLQHIRSIEKEIDHNHNTEGLYVFLSPGTAAYLRTSWPPEEDRVYLDDAFALRGIIKAFNRSEDYYLLSLSQQGAQLYEALNDRVQEEVRGDGFPFRENDHYLTDQLKASDPKSVDNMLREFLNKVDKAMVAAHRRVPLPVIVAANRAVYDMLLQVADQRLIYAGHFAVDGNNSTPLQLSEKAWPLVQDIQKERRADAINEIFAGVPSGKVLTDLQEIWQAARDGRGALLVTREDFAQPIGITDHLGFEFAKDGTVPGITDDIVNDIAWEVLSKNGRVYFTKQPALQELGDIALLTRY